MKRRTVSQPCPAGASSMSAHIVQHLTPALASQRHLCGLRKAVCSPADVAQVPRSPFKSSKALLYSTDQSHDRSFVSKSVNRAARLE